MVVGPARRFQHLVGPLVCGFDKISEMQRIPVRKTFRSLVFSDGAGEVVALFVCEVIGYALNERDEVIRRFPQAGHELGADHFQFGPLADSGGRYVNVTSTRPHRYDERHAITYRHLLDAEGAD